MQCALGWEGADKCISTHTDTHTHTHNLLRVKYAYIHTYIYIYVYLHIVSMFSADRLHHAGGAVEDIRQPCGRFSMPVGICLAFGAKILRCYGCL